jgi:hypothetical protein
VRPAAAAFAILAGCANLPPEIEQLSMRAVEPGVELAVAVGAHDPDGDPLSFELAVAPPGATLAPTPGSGALIRWLPGAADVGEHLFVVSASDGAFVRHRGFRVAVRFSAGGSPPVFVAPLAAGLAFDPAAERCVDVPVEVADPDSLRVTVALVAPSPAGAVLTPETGFRHRLVWCPSGAAAAVAPVRFVLAATDGDHARVDKSYLVVPRVAP